MPKILRIIAMFFTLALMCAQVAVQASSNPASTLVFTELANAPPGHTQMAIVNTNELQVVDQQAVRQPIICQQIARGVSVPYLGLINKDLLYIDVQRLKCNKYYTTCRIDNMLRQRLSNRTGILQNTNEFATDLGVRYTSSVSA
jgi:hypothetical protein